MFEGDSNELNFINRPIRTISDRIQYSNIRVFIWWYYRNLWSLQRIELDWRCVMAGAALQWSRYTGWDISEDVLPLWHEMPYKEQDYIHALGKSCLGYDTSCEMDCCNDQLCFYFLFLSLFWLFLILFCYCNFILTHL